MVHHRLTSNFPALTAFFPVNSSHRWTITSQNFSSSSIRNARRPICSAAMSVDPLPPNKSRTFHPGLLEFRISLPTRFTGFIVGCTSFFVGFFSKRTVVWSWVVFRRAQAGQASCLHFHFCCHPVCLQSVINSLMYRAGRNETRKKIKVISGKASGLPRAAGKINKSSTYDLCITDKAKETSSCADLFRCGAASVCLVCGVFALCLGVPASLIRLPRCYYYITCKWCMVSHLSSDAGVLLALVPWLPCAVRAARVTAGCVREPGLAVCPASWPACVPVAWCCGAVLCPAPWCVGLLCLPLWAGLVPWPCV